MSMTRDMVIASLGLSRLALFDKAGVEFFPNSKDAALRSFWIPALSAPIWIYGMLLGVPPVFSDLSAGILYGVLGLGLVNTMCGYYLAASSISRALGREALFARYVTANNWAVLLYMVVMLPAFFIAVFEIGSPETQMLYDQMGKLVMLAYMWFIARHALQLGALGAVGMVFMNITIFLIAMFGSMLILTQAAGGIDYVQSQLEAYQHQIMQGAEQPAN